MKTVTRAHLVAAAHDAVIAERSDCENIVRQTFEEIANALVAGEQVLISRFGTFRQRRPPRDREGRNPKTGVPAVIKPSTRVVFRAANELKHTVKTGRSE